MRNLLIVLILAAVVPMLAASSCEPVEEHPFKEVTPIPVAISTTVAPVASVAPAGIIPCTDGSQVSCEVWQLAFSTFSQGFPDASITWLDCAATYVSNTYTAEQIASFTDTEQEEAAGNMLIACAGVQ